jgi:hypothetical protein
MKDVKRPVRTSPEEVYLAVQSPFAARSGEDLPRLGQSWLAIHDYA